MFGHYDVSHNHEPVFLSHLFESRKEAKSAARMTEKRQSSITGASDKVQVMRAVGAMQAAGHDKSHSIGSIVPALAKNARTGHPQFGNGKQNPEPRATRPDDFPCTLTKLAQNALDTLALAHPSSDHSTEEFQLMSSGELVFSERIYSFILRRTASRRQGKIQMIRHDSNRVQVIWEGPATAWDTNAHLLQGVIDSKIPCHQYFGGTGTDAELEIAFGERRPHRALAT